MSWLSVVFAKRLVPESRRLWIDCYTTGRLVDTLLPGFLFGLHNLLKGHHLLTPDIFHRDQVGRLIDVVEPNLLLFLGWAAAILILESWEALCIRILLQHGVFELASVL